MRRTLLTSAKPITRQVTRNRPRTDITGWKGVFHLAHRGLNRRPQVASFFLMGQAPPPPLGQVRLLLAEAQMKPEVLVFPFGLDKLLSGRKDRPDRRLLQSEQCSFSSGCQGEPPYLLLGTGNLGWLTTLRLLDLEICHIELLRTGGSTANTGLDLLHQVLLQRLIRIWASIATLREKCFQIRALFQVGQRFHQ